MLPTLLLYYLGGGPPGERAGRCCPGVRNKHAYPVGWRRVALFVLLSSSGAASHVQRCGVTARSPGNRPRATLRSVVVPRLWWACKPPGASVTTRCVVIETKVCVCVCVCVCLWSLLRVGQSVSCRVCVGARAVHSALRRRRPLPLGRGWRSRGRVHCVGVCVCVSLSCQSEGAPLYGHDDQRVHPGEPAPGAQRRRLLPCPVRGGDGVPQYTS